MLGAFEGRYVSHKAVMGDILHPTLDKLAAHLSEVEGRGNVSPVQHLLNSIETSERQRGEYGKLSCYLRSQIRGDTQVVVRFSRRVKRTPPCQDDCPRREETGHRSRTSGPGFVRSRKNQQGTADPESQFEE